MFEIELSEKDIEFLKREREIDLGEIRSIFRNVIVPPSIGI